MNRDFARELRRNTTDAERRLWTRLRYRQLGHKFRRQQPIGTYIVDFVCLEKRVVVELDGGQHAEQVESDKARTNWLNNEGFTVLRFWNNEILESLDAVVEVIWNNLKAWGSGGGLVWG